MGCISFILKPTLRQNRIVFLVRDNGELVILQFEFSPRLLNYNIAVNVSFIKEEGVEDQKTMGLYVISKKEMIL